VVAISRVKVEFSGAAVVGPAASSFFTTGQVQNLRNPLITLWQVLKGQMPPTCTITIPNTGETYDDVTGDLVDVWTDGTTSTQVGEGLGNFARGVGARIVWSTNGVTNNRRVKGSTYVVPITAAAYGPDGTIADGVITAWNAATGIFVAATQSDLIIWTRPVTGGPGQTGSAGKSQGVTGATVPDRISTLRSRRV